MELNFGPWDSYGDIGPGDIGPTGLAYPLISPNIRLIFDCSKFFKASISAVKPLNQPRSDLSDGVSNVILGGT